MLWTDERKDIGMDFQRLKTTSMGESEFNNLSVMLKTTIIFKVTLIYERFFFNNIVL